MKFHLKVWRQKDANAPGTLENYEADNIPADASFLEMPLHINLTHFDHRTKFEDICEIPSNPWSAKAKATKKEPNDNEEDKKPNAF